MISGMGIGGGAILIPALTILLSVSQKVAQGINLVYFIPTAICALFVHIKKKNVEIKTSLIIGLSGIIGSVSGAFITSYLNSDILRRLFGIFLFGIGIYEIYVGVSKGRKNKTID